MADLNDAGPTRVTFTSVSRLRTAWERFLRQLGPGSIIMDDSMGGTLSTDTDPDTVVPTMLGHGFTGRAATSGVALWRRMILGAPTVRTNRRLSRVETRRSQFSASVQGRGAPVPPEENDTEIDEVVVDNDRAHRFWHAAPGQVPTGTAGHSRSSETASQHNLVEYRAASVASSRAGCAAIAWHRVVVPCWIAFNRFFRPRFDSKRSEEAFHCETWYTQKSNYIFGAFFLIVDWVLSAALLPHPWSTWNFIEYCLLGPVVTLPLLPLVIFDIPLKYNHLWQRLLFVTLWLTSTCPLLEMHICNFYSDHPTCHGKDFLTVLYYATAIPCIGIFALGQSRSSAALLVISWIITAGAAILTDRVSFIRDIIFVALFMGFIITAHYWRELADRRMFALRAELKIQFRAKQRAEISESKTMDSKRRFSSYIFHEVRVPLNTALLAFQNLSAANVMSKKSEYAMEYQALEGSLQTMSQVLNDVLDFSRMERGGFSSISRPFSFHRMIGTIVMPLQIVVAQKGLTLVTNLDRRIDDIARRAAYPDDPRVRSESAPEGSGVVMGDEMRLRQVISNLCSNACKFTAAGGQIFITTRLVYPSEPAEDEEFLDFSHMHTTDPKKEPSVPPEESPIADSHPLRGTLSGTTNTSYTTSGTFHGRRSYLSHLHWPMRRHSETAAGDARHNVLAAFDEKTNPATVVTFQSIPEDRMSSYDSEKVGQSSYDSEKAAQSGSSDSEKLPASGKTEVQAFERPVLAMPDFGRFSAAPGVEEVPKLPREPPAAKVAPPPPHRSPDRPKDVPLSPLSPRTRDAAPSPMPKSSPEAHMPTGPAEPTPSKNIVIRIEITDTGVGIRPSDMAENRLFSAYVQTEIGRKQGGKGTGLGLSLVRQIVMLSGGRLGVRSKLGQGSTFWVELPFQVGPVTRTYDEQLEGANEKEFELQKEMDREMERDTEKQVNATAPVEPETPRDERVCAGGILGDDESESPERDGITTRTESGSTLGAEPRPLLRARQSTGADEFFSRSTQDPSLLSANNIELPQFASASGNIKTADNSTLTTRIIYSPVVELQQPYFSEGNTPVTVTETPSGAPPAGDFMNHAIKNSNSFDLDMNLSIANMKMRMGGGVGTGIVGGGSLGGGTMNSNMGRRLSQRDAGAQRPPLVTSQSQRPQPAVRVKRVPRGRNQPDNALELHGADAASALTDTPDPPGPPPTTSLKPPEITVMTPGEAEGASGLLPSLPDAENSQSNRGGVDNVQTKGMDTAAHIRGSASAFMEPDAQTATPPSETSRPQGTQTANKLKNAAPVAVAKDNGATKKAPSKTKSQGVRVLVVDDDTLTRRLMSRMITRLGCEVDTAENGALALDKILYDPADVPAENATTAEKHAKEISVDKSNYDIIFLDNQMPVCTGLQVASKLRSLGRNDLVVGVTANALLSDQHEYLASGANFVLTKPVFEADLRKYILLADQKRKGNVQ